ncbi:MAG: hypothetical protein O7G87_01920, partial [bacterium]|nr:hypothetical protein [bacterium]
MCDATSSNEAILTAIRHTVPTLLPNRPEVSDIQPVSQSRHHSVWKVGTRDGTLLAVKHQPFAPFTKNRPYDLLEVEQHTCKLLGASQAPIPHLVGINRDHDLIFSQWCGDLTLDDVCQTSNAQTIAQVGKYTINGFLAFEAAFRQHTPDLAHRAFPGCDPESLLKTWGEIIGPISDRL